jgi:HEAT repeat protein
MKEPLNQSLHQSTLAQLAAKNAKVRAEALESLAATNFVRLPEIAAQALSDQSPVVRTTAIEILTDSGEKSAFSRIKDRLSDPNAEVRMRAAEALGTLPNKGKIPKQLVDLLNDKDVLVRVAAAESLGLMRNRRAVPALRQALHDRSPLVRSYVAEALGKIGDKGQVPLLRGVLNKEQNEIARVGAFKALYELGDKEILRSLLMILTSARDYRARCAAANGLAELPLNTIDKQTTIKSVRQALRSERTVAVRSSMRSSLEALTGKRMRAKP